MILAIPQTAWQPAINADRSVREGAEVAELTGRVDLVALAKGQPAHLPPPRLLAIGPRQRTRPLTSCLPVLNAPGHLMKRAG